MSGFSVIKDFAQQLFTTRSVEKHPLMLALAEGRLDPAKAQIVAIQIYHVVNHFPRLLAGLLSNLPDWQRRTPIVENLWEEHGRGKPHLVHVETYKTFLASMSIDPEAIARSQPGLSALVYNRAVLDLCLHHHYAEGLGALGVIEEIVARASPLVTRHAKSQQGPERREIGHFSDHEVLDVTHANEFYELAATEVHGEHRSLVERGMELGHYYHLRLYSDLAKEVSI